MQEIVLVKTWLVLLCYLLFLILFLICLVYLFIDYGVDHVLINLHVVSRVVSINDGIELRRHKVRENLRWLVVILITLIHLTFNTQLFYHI